MICTSIQHKTIDEILGILDDPYVELAEIRLDLCPLSDKETEELFSDCEKPLIATYRVSATGPDAAVRKAWDAALQKLEIASQSGVRYIDLDLGAPAPVSQRVQKMCRNNGNELIRSWHDFNGTPDAQYLQQIVSRCFRYGADIAKVVTTAATEQDCERVLSLYDMPGLVSGTLTAFAMGEVGASTRIKCLALGAPLTYCAYDEPTASGQLGLEAMHKAVYGDFYGIFRDDFEVPSSKSFAQRAILAAALADGTSHLRGYTPCQDSEAAVELVRKMGAKVYRNGKTLTIKGIGATSGLGLDIISVGESGLLARLSAPILSTLNGKEFVVDGSGTLPGRALRDAAGIMASFGVMLSNRQPQSDRQIHVPFGVSGTLVSGNAVIDATAGSQLISGLLMALPLVKGDSCLEVRNPKSIPYMFITMDVLRRFGVNIQAQMEGDQERLEAQDWSACTGIRFSIKGEQKYSALEMDLEGDWSAAANFLVAGALFGAVEIDSLDTSSLQADISILDVLVEAGAAVASGEDSVSVHKAPLDAFDVDLSQSPDIFPIVSLLAAFCPGESNIAGASRLSGKESDRAEAIVSTLTQMGVRAIVEGDVLTVQGESLCSRLLHGRLLRGGEYTCFHDHRMAMMLRVASIGADGAITVDDPKCVAKSFPDFYEEFR